MEFCLEIASQIVKKLSDNLLIAGLWTPIKWIINFDWIFSIHSMYFYI